MMFGILCKSLLRKFYGMRNLAVFETIDKQKTVESRFNLLVLLINFIEHFMASHEVDCLVEFVVY